MAMATPAVTSASPVDWATQTSSLLQTLSEAAADIRGKKGLTLEQTNKCREILLSLHAFLLPFHDVIYLPVLKEVAFYVSTYTLQGHYPLIKTIYTNQAYRACCNVAHDGIDEEAPIPQFPKPDVIPDGDKTVDWLAENVSQATLYLVQQFAISVLNGHPQKPDMERCHVIYDQIKKKLQKINYIFEHPGLAHDDFYSDVNEVRKYLKDETIKSIMLKLYLALHYNEDLISRISSRANSAPSSPFSIPSSGSPATPLKDRHWDGALNSPSKPLLPVSSAPSSSTQPVDSPSEPSLAGNNVPSSPSRPVDPPSEPPLPKNTHPPSSSVSHVAQPPETPVPPTDTSTRATEATPLFYKKEERCCNNCAVL